MLREETKADHQAVRELHHRAFDETKVSDLNDALRAAQASLPALSFVSEDDSGRIIGHVLLSASRLDAPRELVDVYVLSPLAVLPEYQRKGHGAALIAHAIDAADRKNVPLIFVEGDSTYYGPRGFQPATSLNFRSPSLRIPEPAFQVRLLTSYEPWMTGTLVYSEMFWAFDSVGLR